MSDLISREWCLTEYDKRHNGLPGNARKIIEEAQAVDAVHVVRCEDCKYFISSSIIDDMATDSHCGLVDSVNVHGYRNGEPSNDTTLLWRNKNDYCSRGEKNE